MSLTAHETRKLARSLDSDATHYFKDVREAVAFLGGSGLKLRKDDYRALCDRLKVESDGPVRALARRLAAVGRECRNDAAKAVVHRRNFRGVTVVFLDMGASFISAVREQLEGVDADAHAGGPYHFEYITGLVDRVPRESTAFVSPANSMGYMRGGIDGAYSNMFLGVEGAVQDAMKQTGRYPLPVGDAVAVLVDSVTNTWLIAAPTMPRPGMNVHSTQNARAAFEAALRVFDVLTVEAGVTRLVCPGLCTGVGGMSVENCASQIRAAIGA